MGNDVLNNIDDNKEKEVIVCSNCGEVIENLKEGCKNCNGNKKYITQSEYSKIKDINLSRNKIASIWDMIAGINIVLGIISVFILFPILFDSGLEHPLLWLIVIILGIGLESLIFSTIADAMQMLHDIRYKLWEK